MRPATSITVTSPTCRVLNFTLTEYASWLKPQNLFRHQILDQSYFGPPGLQPPHLEVVHERPDEENAPAGSTQQVFRGQRVGDRPEIEAFALIADTARKALPVGSHRKPDLLM